MPVQEVGASNSRALQDIADAITRSHKILVVTGAGISTSCGIPDFRSKDGLYNLIPEQHIYPTPPSSEPSTPRRKRKASEMDEDQCPSSQSSNSSANSRRTSTSPASRMKGQDLFHSRVFQNSETTEVFYQFIASLRQKIMDDVKDTSATHKFIRALRDGGRLMRCYTQNIDGLEAREGLCMDLTRGKGSKRRFMKKHIESPRPDVIQGTDFDGGCEVVQLHGELTKLRCTMCSVEEDWTDGATEELLVGSAPECLACSTKSEIRQATGKRGLTVGGLRPNIVLYGEEHPQNTLLSPFVPYDIQSNPDILIIMGTSLKVHGLQKIIRNFAKAVHAQKSGKVIFVNRTRPAESVWDGVIDDFVAMECDDWVNDLKCRRDDLWMRQGELNLKLKTTKSATTEDKQTKKRKMTIDIHEDNDSNACSRVAKKAKSSHKSTFSIDIPHKRLSKCSQPVGKARSDSAATTKQSATAAARGSSTPKRSPGSKFKLASPQRPDTFSPITPAFSPLTPRSSSRMNSTPSGRFGRSGSSTTNTPSRIRTKMRMQIRNILNNEDDENENRKENSGPKAQTVHNSIREASKFETAKSTGNEDEHTRTQSNSGEGPLSQSFVGRLISWTR